MAQDEGYRPDLDGLIDGTLASLTTVDDRRVEASRLRTMSALQGNGVAGRRAGRLWPVMAAGTLVAILIVLARLPRPGQDVPAPAGVLASRSLSTIASAPAPIDSQQVAPAGARRRQESRLRPVGARDPLVDLVRAVNAIPEDAWTRGEAAASTAGLIVREIAVEPLALAPLDVSAPVPTSPGEPR